MRGRLPAGPVTRPKISKEGGGQVARGMGSRME
jgi:hypothetical protein